MSSTEKTVRDQLAAVDLFRGLSKRELKRLVELSERVEHTPGNQIAKEGLGALAFHLVVEGEARVSVGGKSLGTLRPGQYFGEISMIDGRPRSADVEAVGALTTIAVPHLVFQRLLDEEPEFARTLLVLLCARLREAQAG